MIFSERHPIVRAFNSNITTWYLLSGEGQFVILDRTRVKLSACSQSDLKPHAALNIKTAIYLSTTMTGLAEINREGQLMKMTLFRDISMITEGRFNYHN